MHDLFETLEGKSPSQEPMAEGAMLLHGEALRFETELLAALTEITANSPFRHMVAPGGYTMSVAMANCGTAGWVTDRTGYRYDRHDPENRRPWLAIPACFRDPVTQSAAHAGYPGFRPDACLINWYGPGARLSLHQDVTSPIRSSRSRWACRRHFCSAA
jgi:DNA oxidative demethylase